LIAVFIDQPRLQFGSNAVPVPIHLGPETRDARRIVYLDLPLADRSGDGLDVAEITGRANTSRIG